VAAVVLIALLLVPPSQAAAIEVSEAGAPGTVAVKGFGFQARELVDIMVNHRLVHTIDADATGAFSIDIPVGGAAQGTVTAHGRSSGRADDAGYSVHVPPGSESPGTSIEPSTSPSAPASPSIEPSETPSQPASTEASICPGSNEFIGHVRLERVPAGSIVYHSNFSDASAQTDYEVYAIDPKTGRIYQLTDNGVDDENPAWYTGDYHALAYARGPDGARDIRLLYEGGVDVPLFTDESDDWFPAWSVDKSIAFVRGRQPSSIWTYVGGAGLSNQPTWEGDIVRSPAWSPDGRQLAFFGNLSAKDYDLAIKPPPEGRDVVTRIEGTHELNPTWSPDGQTLALVQRVGQSATSDIYLFDIRTQKLSGP
jgi:hypothetical protein